MATEILKSLFEKAYEYAKVKFGKRPDSIEIKEDGTIEATWSEYQGCNEYTYTREQFNVEDFFMQKETKLFAHYKQKGHYMYPEDTWKKSREVKTQDDVLQFMKDCHLEDAGNRNDYPILSHWDRWVGFRVQDFVYIDGVAYSSKEIIDSEPPEFYDAAYKQYTEWELRLKVVIEKKREHDKEKRSLISERDEYERLKEKFEN